MPRLTQQQRRERMKERLERNRAAAEVAHGSTIDVKPQAKTPSASIAEHHAVCLRAVQALLPPEIISTKIIASRVWSFLRDPTMLMIVHQSGKAWSSDAEGGTITFEVLCEAVSLQTGRSLCNSRMCLTEIEYILFCQCLRGADSMASREYESELGQTWSLHWFLLKHHKFALPICVKDGHGISGGRSVWQGWQISNDGKSLVKAEGDDWIAVASLSRGWLARAWFAGGCEVYDLSTGATLGSCRSIGIADGLPSTHNAFVMVAHDDLILVTGYDHLPIEARQKVDIIKVVQATHTHESSVEILSSTVLKHKLASGRLDQFEAVAVNDIWCAFVCDELPCGWVGVKKTIALYRLGKRGISNKVGAIVRPHSGHVFNDVALTANKLVTLEESFDGKPYEVVVRDCLQPLSPPILVLKQPWSNCVSSNIYCGSDVVRRYKSFVSHRTKKLREKKKKKKEHSDSDCVIQHVEHDEPGAVRDEEVLASHEIANWIENVEKEIMCRPSPYPEGLQASLAEESAIVENPTSGLPKLASASQERVYLLRFGSPRLQTHTNSFRELLLDGPQLKPCREDLAQAGHAYVLQSEAIMAVKPSQHTDVLDKLADDKVELHPFHIIVTETFEYLIEEILMSFPFKQRPRLKPGCRGRQELTRGVVSEVDENGSSLQEDQPATDEEVASTMEGFISTRTFICEAPLLRDARSVTQSTTEVKASVGSQAHYDKFRGVNPRRLLPKGV